MKLKIAICDDEQKQIEYMKSTVAMWAERNRHLVEISTFSSAEAFLFEYSENKSYDILLLDVEMGKMNGVELAREIRRENHSIQLIFVTGYYEYFSDGFDVSALHYLIKPATNDKLYPVLDRAVASLQYRERSVLIDTGDCKLKIPLTDIIYVESERVYLIIHTSSGEYRTRLSLTKFAESLDDTFYKVHRSYIVSLKYIRKITRTEIVMDGGSTVPMSRGMYDEVHSALIKYL